MKLLTTLLFIFLLTHTAYAQLGTGGLPHSSAALDVQATDKAFYPPRLTTAQRKAIANPQAGAFVFDVDKGTFFLFDGQNWLPLALTTNNSLNPIERTASDGEARDEFGSSVAISGDYALVGSPSDDIGANVDQGSVYVFMRSGNSWTQQTKLTIAGGRAGDKFGSSVAFSGNYALVGSPNATVFANANQGVAYVFERSGSVWSQRPVLYAADGETGDNFGASVAISGIYALVGSPKDDIEANANQGSAYVFVRSGSTWYQQARLLAGDGAADNEFGAGVAISETHAVVGSPRQTVGSNAIQGAAYVFVRSSTTWPQQARLLASDGAAEDRFGYSVSLSGDYALVGSYSKSIFSIFGRGAAYVFVRLGGGWSQQARLLAPNGKTLDHFGTSVALSGDYALIGSPFAAVGDIDQQGAAYLFKREGTEWLFIRKVTDNSTGITRNHTCGISNGRYIIGGFAFQNFQGKVGFGTVED
ncbi:FG-GAP repeat protein [Arundinibacter roseus]|uniref:Integrin n=1 Tax=Arundinibacter roseus TaxID=2070510 RepID=A0A4R4JZK5_9BACT|nr:FG-GAP repeat protein [Arundinibacter roseus]TDB59129.1 hypothetical protein EZE20_22630 [Arundinibacter roseus]